MSVDLDKVRLELQKRLNHLRYDAAGWIREAEQLQQRAAQSIAEARGIEDALDRLKE